MLGAQALGNTSQVVVQVHNGSLPDLISPDQKSSATKPVNIMLGSSTRFSKEHLTSNRKFYPQECSANDAVPVGEEDPSAFESGKNISSFNYRKASQESGPEYRQNLKKIRPRVDCWNRSGTREAATPNTRKNQMNSEALGRADSYRGKSDSGIKTPVQGCVSRSDPRQAVGSFANCARPQTAVAKNS